MRIFFYFIVPAIIVGFIIGAIVTKKRSSARVAADDETSMGIGSLILLLIVTGTIAIVTIIWVFGQNAL